MSTSSFSLAGLALAAWLAAPAPENDAPETPAEAEALVEDRKLEEPREVNEGPLVVDEVLPCGLRVIVAQDGTLPVAAVVLAVEVGTRDDPENQPGLVHALAYHLQMGSRELGPGEALATAHDAGGFASMAVGPAQVRFENLVPVTALPRMLRVEAHRLRAPTVNHTLWLKSLGYARRDRRAKGAAPAKIAAAAWDDAALEHDGRRVTTPLAELADGAVAAQLARQFAYHRATLVVVAPTEPKEVLEDVRALFAELPARGPQAWSADPRPPALEAKAREVTMERARGDMLALPVQGTPAARTWAQAACAAVNRLPRESKDVRLRCTAYDDVRRPVLLFRARGAEVFTLTQDKLAALEGSRALSQQLAKATEKLDERTRLPLELAAWLAGAGPREAGAPGARPLDQLTGLAELQVGTSVPPGLIAPERGAVLVGEGEAPQATPDERPPPTRKPGSTPSSEAKEAPPPEAPPPEDK